jgi:hypothetical protein
MEQMMILVLQDYESIWLHIFAFWQHKTLNKYYSQLLW